MCASSQGGPYIGGRYSQTLCNCAMVGKNAKLEAGRYGDDVEDKASRDCGGPYAADGHGSGRRGVGGNANGHGGAGSTDRHAQRRYIYGLSGWDFIVGKPGADELHGGRGSDTLEGRYGNDYIVGGRGYDELEGFEGNDRIQAADGRQDFVGAVLATTTAPALTRRTTLGTASSSTASRCRSPHSSTTAIAPQPGTWRGYVVHQRCPYRLVKLLDETKVRTVSRQPVQHEPPRLPFLLSLSVSRMCRDGGISQSYL